MAPPLASTPKRRTLRCWHEESWLHRNCIIKVVGAGRGGSIVGCARSPHRPRRQGPPWLALQHMREAGTCPNAELVLMHILRFCAPKWIENIHGKI